MFQFLILLFLYEVMCRAFVPQRFMGSESGKLFAKFTPGAIVSEIRNKIAATVFTKNGAGAAIRNRVTPINRRSPLQTNRRQRLASLSSQWRGLTEVQRAGWNAASGSFPVQDNLGQTIFLTGAQLYNRCNANLLLIGAATISNAPTPTSFAILTAGASLPDSAGTFTQAFTPTPVPTGFALVIRATGPKSAGISAPSQSDFRFVQSVPAAGASPANIFANYSALFGDMAGAADQKVFVEMYLMEVASGLAGQVVRTSAIVA